MSIKRPLAILVAEEDYTWSVVLVEFISVGKALGSELPRLDACTGRSLGFGERLSCL